MILELLLIPLGLFSLASLGIIINEVYQEANPKYRFWVLVSLNLISLFAFLLIFILPVNSNMEYMDGGNYNQDVVESIDVLAQ